MEQSKFSVLAKRFLRGFVTTAIPIVLLQLKTIEDVTNIHEVQKAAIALIIPLASGLLLAAEKALRWVEPTEPEPLTHEEQ